MNLIQVQERLKSLPSSPQTMQALMAYANGMNPAVPPYLALGELNRRKQLMEEAQQQQAGQPPQGTVKDQVAQSAGLMALQQGQQQQAMQNAMRMGAMQPQQVPPQTAAAGPVQMASGGIVALQAAGSVDEAVDEVEEEEDDEDVADQMVASAPTAPTGTAAMLAEVIRKGQEELIKNRPVRETRAQREARLIAEDPSLADARKDTSEDLLKRLDEMQALRRAEIEKQREEAARLRPGVLQQLGQAAMASRGQYGRSALASILGGYGDIASRSEAEQVKQEQALRGRELELQQVRMDTLNKIDEIKRARAEGRMKDAFALEKEVDANLRAHNTSLSNLFGRQASALGRLAGQETAAASRERVAQTGAEARRDAAREATKRAGIVKPSEKERIMNRVAALRAAGKDDEADRLISSYNALSGSTAGVGGINTQRNILGMRLREVNRVLDPKNLGTYSEEDINAAKAERTEILRQLNELGVPGQPKPSAAPSSAPPANLLKKGVNTTFQNGQTWTLGADGKPKQVK